MSENGVNVYIQCSVIEKIFTIKGPLLKNVDFFPKILTYIDSCHLKGSVFDELLTYARGSESLRRNNF